MGLPSRLRPTGTLRVGELGGLAEQIRGHPRGPRYPRPRRRWLNAAGDCGRPSWPRRLPDDLQREIVEAYADLCREYGPETDIGRPFQRHGRGSADRQLRRPAGVVPEHPRRAGAARRLPAVHASLFTDRAISYRVDKGFDHFAVALSVGVQKMVRSDLGAAGVLFTLDTESGFPDVVLINSAYGLGESVVKGRVDPDEFLVFKPTLKQGFRPILKANGRRQAGEARSTRPAAAAAPASSRCPPRTANGSACTDEEVLTLARWGCLIEDHYSAKAGQPTPMDIEWAQGRPDRRAVHPAGPAGDGPRPSPQGNAGSLSTGAGTGPENCCKGRSVGEKIGAGPVRIVGNVDELAGLSSPVRCWSPT